eukprot:3810179-Prorocentrum_lima.AAC.1
MKARGHPAYRRLDEAETRRRAEELLPENGVPSELYKILELDDTQEKLQPQKQATPSDEAKPQEAFASLFTDLRPRGVVAEGSSTEMEDVNNVLVSAMEHLGRRLTTPDTQEPQAPPTEQSVPNLGIVTGNVLVDCFKP